MQIGYKKMKNLSSSSVLIRYSIREALGLAMMGTALFWPALTLHWWQGWVVLADTLLWTIGMAVVILCVHPALLAERLGPRPGARTWDTVIMSLLGIAQLARYILAGFDHRLGWSGSFPAVLQIAAALLCLMGYALVVWAAGENAFFSQIVRLQPERGQEVVNSGPYRLVRHPAYLGSIIVEIAIPILLGSFAALSISILTLFLLALRTRLEDNTLMIELPGYKEYSRQTRFRLFPFIW
jgi:protein-S-isoprenylcysteine O-methyltransferase Ste14